MDANQQLKDFLDAYKERAEDAYQRGNKYGGMYLAMIAGMWANTCRLPRDPNIFANSENELYMWYIYGHDANEDAIRSNEKEMELRKKMEEIKAKNAKKNKDTKSSSPSDKKSIWKTNLW